MLFVTKFLALELDSL